MRTVRTKVYKFEELSKEAQREAIQNFRNINNSDDFWFDAILEGFINQLEEEGFLNSTIEFSGFWQQGDGLCFDAKVNVSKFATTTNEIRVSKLIDFGFIDEFTIEKTSFANHYSHEKTRYIDYSICNGNNLNNELEKLCNKIELKRLNLCREFYSILEKDYCFLESDECVKETIIANEYEFLKDGTKF